MLLISIAVNGYQVIQNKKIKKNFISLFPGESIPNFELASIKNKSLVSEDLIKCDLSLLCIFESPCASCNNNLEPWRNLIHYFKESVVPIGVIPDGDFDNLSAYGNDRVNFELFYPTDISKFKRKMRLKTNFAQTIILNKGKVVDVKIGNLAPSDIEYLMKSISRLVDDSRR